MHKKKAGKLQTGSTFPKQYWLAVNGKPKTDQSQARVCVISYNKGYINTKSVDGCIQLYTSCSLIFRFSNVIKTVCLVMDLVIMLDIFCLGTGSLTKAIVCFMRKEIFK